MLEKLIESYSAGFDKAFHTMAYGMTSYQQKLNPAFVDNSVIKTTMYVDKDRMECLAKIDQLPKPETRAQKVVHAVGFIQGYYMPKLFIPRTYPFFPENC
jgi:hypothetical protein